MPDEPRPLKAQIRLLIANWPIIAVAAIVCGLLGFAYAMWRPDSFESTMMVLVNPPPFKSIEPESGDRNLEERRTELAEMMPRTLPIEMYRSIALSNGVIKQVHDEIEGLDEPIEVLRDRLRVELVQLGSRSPVWGTQYGQALFFYARAKTPELSARMVQRWSDVFKQHADEVAVSSLDESFDLIEELWASTRSELEVAEDALSEFQGQWNVRLLELELSSKERLLSELKARLERTRIEISRLQAESEVLEMEVGAEAPILTLFKAPSEEAYWLAQATSEEGSGGVIDEGRGLRTEEFNPVFLEARNRQIETATSLKGLEAEDRQVHSTIDKLTRQIQDLQKQIAQKSTEEQRLKRNVETFSGTISLLSEKLEKSKIARRNRSSDIEILSEAVAPETPIGTPYSLNLLFALGVGALLGAAYILIANSLRQSLLDTRP